MKKNQQASNKNKPSTSFSSSYSTDPYINSARLVSCQIEENKNECCSIISQYGVDSNELLHLLEQWTQLIIYEYKGRREYFKLLLKDKWERGELNSVRSGDQSDLRLVHVHIQKLNEWQQVTLPDMKRQLDELQPTSNVKELTSRLIDNLFQISSSITAIHQAAAKVGHGDQLQTSGSLNEMLEQLKRLKAISEKEHNTICIIGLEKAGKSSFINALLGFELLPFRIERCTQIQTILKPPSKENPDLFATIEFYDQNEFSSLIDNLPKEKEETDNAYQKRATLIYQTRQEHVSKDALIKHYQASNDAQAQAIIKELHKYIANEVFLNIVKHVIIYTAKLPGKDYILLDVPGCDSPVAEHRASAIRAVQNSDAFLFLTDGQRPSLTNDQVHLLHEIHEGHFDGMKRAFGIITKLDLCQTRSKYLEHRAKTQIELEQKSFPREHIFTVAANVSLLEQTQADRNQLRQIKERVQQYDSLLGGFDQCKQTLHSYIEHDLPHSRLRQVVNMAQQKIARFVQDTIKVGQQLIPSETEESLEEYIKRLNTEQWNDIFDKERYLCVLSRAAFWQKDTLATKRYDCTRELIRYFQEEFRMDSDEIMKKVHSVEQKMLEKHDIAVFQMNPYEIETQEREMIVESMLAAVKLTSSKLTKYMYEKYVQELEKILNDICPEQGDLFHTTLTLEQCEIQVKTLVLRVSHPVIIASIRWPYVFKDNRIAAAEELARIAPTVAYNVYENSQQDPNNSMNNLGKTIAGIFESAMVTNVQNGILNALFRR
ncbi:unnamed protein product [Adineta ricciae]|uniref:Dynamin N-terminal domain-containing protein n=1 Tax=Adineta ricciae TaxID=249248 RepID=A0A815MN45_ADIRI|nr:unnamed protein product [Adineta ricciae]CAF1460098.1 unnamed protein product [Adineta ricciae]